MSTNIRQARIRGLRRLALGFALCMTLMSWSVALAHADVAPTATALSCTPESTEAGQSVHCTATVRGILGSSGQVRFKSENGGEFSANPCRLTFGEKGLASCGVEFVPAANGASQVRLHALYVGDAANASSEGAFTLTILPGKTPPPPAPAPTATALSCAPDSVKVGEQAHCTATVKGIVGQDAGRVAFKTEQGGAFSATSCKLVFGDLGLASCAVDYTPPEGAGSDRIHASFVGNEVNASSEDTFTVTILSEEEEGGEEVPPAPSPTVTALSCAPDSTEAGQPVHCTATVSGVVGSSSGRVVFKSENGGTFSAGSCELSFGKGLGSCGVDFTAPADGATTARLHALYVGDAANASSEGAFTLTILAGKGGGGKDPGGKVSKAAHPNASRAHAQRRHRSHHPRHRSRRGAS